MESLIVGVDWTAVVVGAVLAFIAGIVWYAVLFGKKWRAGVGISEDDNSPMTLSMIAQIGSTFFFSWVIGVALAMNALPLAILIVLTIMGTVKANGLFAHNSYAAISIDATYVLVMAVIMIGTHAVL